MGAKFILILVCLIAAIGCETNFQPLEENTEFKYTMYGILDLSADTHWVRVMPVRSSILRDSIDNDITVTLIRESTGEHIPMQDSLHTLAQNNYVWNFWTDIPLYPSESYTVQAVTEEGEITSATATIPPDYPQPRVEFSERTNRCHITISDLVENIAVAEIEYSFRIPVDASFEPDTSDTFYHTVSYLNSIEPVFNGYEFTVDELPIIAGDYGVTVDQLVDLYAEILVVSADSNWQKTNPDEGEIPGVNSNVKNGLGLVSGIVSKRLPLRPTIEDQQDMLFCPPVE